MFERMMSCQRKRTTDALLFGLACLAALPACVPQIVIVDRYSVIEEESAGDWPELEADLRLLNARVRPFEQTVTTGSERETARRALNVMPLGSSNLHSMGQTSGEERATQEESASSQTQGDRDKEPQGSSVQGREGARP